MPRSLEEDAESLRIGVAIHRARQEKNWSIKEMSHHSGLSTGMISQIERGLSLPSLKSLIMLANALEVPVGRFFDTPGEGPPTGSSIYVVHKNERRMLKLTPMGLTKQYLSPEIAGILDLFEVKLSPGGSSGPEFFPHKGEKAGLVLQGSLRLWLSDVPTVLSAGDSFRFPSDMPHRFDNPGSEETHLVWIALNSEKAAPLLRDGAIPEIEA